MITTLPNFKRGTINKRQSDMNSSPPQPISKPKKHPSVFFLLFISICVFTWYSLRTLCVGSTVIPFVATTTTEGMHQESDLRVLDHSTAKSHHKHRKSKTLSTALLQQPLKSNQFSVLATNFFEEHNCELKFFMTWISTANSFGPRELISVESIFKFHPNACLLIVSTSLSAFKGVKTLQLLSKKGFWISTLSPDFASLFKNTPAEHWFANLVTGVIDPGEISIGQNLSNLLRLALLYKYGGIYIDTDFLVLQNMSRLRNALGAQTVDIKTGNWSRLNNAVMIFDKGHPLVYEFMEEFAATFDGNKWGHNGPYLVSRVVSRVEGKDGFEFTVVPPGAFYPVDWTRMRGLFRGPRGGYQTKWLNAKFDSIRRDSYGLHLWNKQCRGFQVEEGSIVGRLVMECCVLCNFSVSAL